MVPIPPSYGKSMYKLNHCGLFITGLAHGCQYPVGSSYFLVKVIIFHVDPPLDVCMIYGKKHENNINECRSFS